MASREFDVIIFGATGYTGRYVIEELTNSTKSTDIKWAIAGRNVQKLKESLDIVQKYIGNGKCDNFLVETGTIIFVVALFFSMNICNQNIV